MSARANTLDPSIDPVPGSAYPTLQPVATGPNSMPAAWSGVALLHSFSPPLSTDPTPNNPFFQLSVANVACVPGVYLSAQVAGCSYGTWWYVVTANGTVVSTDQGVTFNPVELGWSVPQDWFGAQLGSATCAGASPLNWMDGPCVDWWKVPVHPQPSTLSSATWMWFDSLSGAPVRMMFGVGPPTPTMGDPGQLALFQMFSMTYMPEFSNTAPPEPPSAWAAPTFAGFNTGNPGGYANFIWNGNFGATAFMTPVNEQYNPLPTRVLYVWKADADYEVASDRSQHTLMDFMYSQFPGQSSSAQAALLTGLAPQDVAPPPTSDTSYLINFNSDGGMSSCLTAPNFLYPQEPPDWIAIAGVAGTIEATIYANPVVSPGTTMTIFAVLFPPSGNYYTEATYLWVWYAPQDASGLSSRPVTFMQSQSTLSEGTSLALADYFYYEEFAEPIDPANFAVPEICLLQPGR